MTYPATGTYPGAGGDPWATPALARRHWADAQSLPDDVLAELLTAATAQCATYAPPLAETDPVPVWWSLAVVYQARELQAAATRGESDLIGVGGDGYALRSRPLTGAVKALLRPQNNLGAIG